MPRRRRSAAWNPLRNGQPMSCGSVCRRHRRKSCRSRKDLRPMMRPGMKRSHRQSGGKRRLRSVLLRTAPARSRQLTIACQQRSSSLRPAVNSWWTSRKRSGGQSGRLRHPPQTRLRSMKQIGSLCPLRAQKCRAKVHSKSAGRALCRDMADRAKRKSRPMRPRSDAPFPRRQSLYRQP